MKRGESGLSLVVGIDKPAGMSSHDVVNACRRIFGERRVGHAGTLDPAATGVLLVCVGPATRLDAYLSGHDKTYDAHIVFGTATDTDDAEGEVIETMPVPDEILDEDFAQKTLDSFEGTYLQTPPQYSALKSDGVKAYEAARKGESIDLEPRECTVYGAYFRTLGRREDSDLPYWNVRFHVSKGTYIRALARDIGRAAGSCAHLGSLRRICIGTTEIADCVSLEALEELKTDAALDPVRLLGMRIAFADEVLGARIANGNELPGDIELFEMPTIPFKERLESCTTSLTKSINALEDGEFVSVVQDGVLRAIYAYQAEKASFHAQCVFPIGVMRGMGA